VVDLGDSWWAADVVPETLARTTIGGLGAGDGVNLERPLSAAGRFGGHIVQGHVDATSSVVGRSSLPDGSWLYEFGLPESLTSYVVEKGSVAVDGVSLTVAAISSATFSIAVIPHTHELTVLGQRLVGDLVNIEVDVVAKYVERQMRPTLEGEQS